MLADWVILLNSDRIFANMDPHCPDIARKICTLHKVVGEAKINTRENLSLGK